MRSQMASTGSFGSLFAGASFNFEKLSLDRVQRWSSSGGRNAVSAPVAVDRFRIFGLHCAKLIVDQDDAPATASERAPFSTNEEHSPLIGAGETEWVRLCQHCEARHSRRLHCPFGLGHKALAGTDRGHRPCGGPRHVGLCHSLSMKRETLGIELLLVFLPARRPLAPVATCQARSCSRRAQRLFFKKVIFSLVENRQIRAISLTRTLRAASSRLNVMEAANRARPRCWRAAIFRLPL